MSEQNQDWLSDLPVRISEKLRRVVAGEATGQFAERVSSEGTEAYQVFLASLPKRAAERLQALTADSGPEPLLSEDVCEPQPYLVEVHDGRHLVVRKFSTFEALAARIRSLEGQDCDAVAFYAQHLPISATTPRYLFFPDGEALRIEHHGEPVWLELSAEGVPLQEDHYMGRADMRNVSYDDLEPDEELEELEELEDDPDTEIGSDIDGEIAVDDDVDIDAFDDAYDDGYGDDDNMLDEDEDEIDEDNE